MNYQLSDAEYFDLHECQQQMALITDLCVLNTRPAGEITIEGLGAFLSAQRKTLRDTLKAVEERLEAERVLKATQPEPAPQVSIPPEMLIALMDAACGATTDSDDLLGILDKIYEAGVGHRPYMDALHHYLDVLRGRGLELHTGLTGDEGSRSFIARKAKRTPPAKPGAAKPRKRERLTAST